MTTTKTEQAIEITVTEKRVEAGDYLVTVTVTGGGRTTRLKARVCRTEDAQRSSWGWSPFDQQGDKIDNDSDVKGARWGRVYKKREWPGGGDSSKRAVIRAIRDEVRLIHAIKCFG